MTRILVVDDSPTIRRVVTNILEVSGFDTVEATDGQDALDVLKSGEAKVDLVLLDFVMPRMNGFQFARALKKEEDLGGLPIILMSAKSDRIRAQFVEQTGSLDAIGKPFDAEALLTVVENALRRKNERPTTPKLVDSADVMADVMGSEALLPAAAPVDDEDGGELIILDSIPPEEDGSADPTVLRLGSPSMSLASTLRETLAPVIEELSDPETVLKMSTVLTRDAAIAIIRAATPIASPDPVLLCGDLSVLSASAILQLLSAEGQTGRLVATRGKSEITVTFRGGLVDLVQSREAGDEFRLGRYFVAAGLVKPEEVDAVARGVALPKRELAGDQKKSVPPADKGKDTATGEKTDTTDNAINGETTADMGRKIDRADDAIAEPAKTISVEVAAASTLESAKAPLAEDAITSPGGSDGRIKDVAKGKDAPVDTEAKDDAATDVSGPKSGIHVSTADSAKLHDRGLPVADEDETPIASQDLVIDDLDADIDNETRIVASAFKAKVEMPREASSGVLSGDDVADAPDSSPAPPTVIMSAATEVPKTAGPRPLLGDALVQAGIITEEQLKDALIRQSSELCYELLRWKEGHFELASANPTALADRTKLSLPVAQLVMEGFRRVDAWQSLEKSLGDFESMIYRDDGVMLTMKNDTLTRAEKRVLDAVDGDRTLREVIAASHLGSFDACRILAQFLEARIVRRKVEESS